MLKTVNAHMSISTSLYTCTYKYVRKAVFRCRCMVLHAPAAFWLHPFDVSLSLHTFVAVPPSLMNDRTSSSYRLDIHASKYICISAWSCVLVKINLLTLLLPIPIGPSRCLHFIYNSNVFVHFAADRGIDESLQVYCSKSLRSEGGWS